MPTGLFLWSLFFFFFLSESPVFSDADQTPFCEQAQQTAEEISKDLFCENAQAVAEQTASDLACSNAKEVGEDLASNLLCENAQGIADKLQQNLFCFNAQELAREEIRNLLCENAQNVANEASRNLFCQNAEAVAFGVSRSLLCEEVQNVVQIVTLNLMCQNAEQVASEIVNQLLSQICRGDEECPPAHCCTAEGCSPWQFSAEWIPDDTSEGPVGAVARVVPIQNVNVVNPAQGGIVDVQLPADVCAQIAPACGGRIKVVGGCQRVDGVPLAQGCHQEGSEPFPCPCITPQVPTAAVTVTTRCTKEIVNTFLQNENWLNANRDELRRKCPLESSANGRSNIPGGCGIRFNEAMQNQPVNSIVDCLECGERVFKCCCYRGGRAIVTEAYEEGEQDHVRAEDVERKVEEGGNIHDSPEECNGECFLEVAKKENHNECGWVCPYRFKGDENCGGDETDLGGAGPREDREGYEKIDLYPEMPVYQRPGATAPKYCGACWGEPLIGCQPHTQKCSAQVGDIGCECIDQEGQPLLGPPMCEHRALLDDRSQCKDFYLTGVPVVSGSVLIRRGPTRGAASCECSCGTTVCAVSESGSQTYPGIHVTVPPAFQTQCRSAFLGKSQRDRENGVVQQC